MEATQNLIGSLIESSEEDTERLRRLQLEVDTIFTETHSHFGNEREELKEKITSLEKEKEELENKLSDIGNDYHRDLAQLSGTKDAEIEKQLGEIEDLKSQCGKLAEEKEELGEKIRSVSEEFGKQLEELKEVHGSTLNEAEGKNSELKVRCDHLENEVENLKAQNAGLKIKIQKIKNEEEVSSSSSDEE